MHVLFAANYHGRQACLMQIALRIKFPTLACQDLHNRFVCKGLFEHLCFGKFGWNARFAAIASYKSERHASL